MHETPVQIKLPSGTQIPDHIAIILDGNGRWARARGLSNIEGHKAGYTAMKKVMETARNLGVHTLTVWGFSTENWDRPPAEVEKIMNLVKAGVEEVRKEANKENIRFVHIGRKDRIPKPLMDLITKVEEETKNNKKYILNVAIDYGGRDEIVRATKRIVKDNLDPDKIDEKTFAHYLDTADQPYPYPDLFIRTSGEQRTSGFLPWQMTYAEIYWESDHLPDMTADKLKEAILDYSRRRRRFGAYDKKTSHLKFKPEIAAKFELAWWRLSKIPHGTGFGEYTVKHIKEQFGLSSKLATTAGKYMIEAFIEGKKSKWTKAKSELKKFYKLIRDEVKLAFEPSIVASLEVKLWQKMQDNHSIAEVEELARDLLAETYRISEFQATKAAHLRVLATRERQLATTAADDIHWKSAQDYLEKYYRALKDRVA